MTETQDLTLYFAPRSRSFTALWLLEEAGLPYRLESFDIATGRHKTADFLSLNPMGKVPVLLDQGTPVSELGAIALYLTDGYSAASLGPCPTDPKRPEFLRWLFFASAIMEPAFNQKLLNLDLPSASIAWGSFDQMLEVLSDALKPGTWLQGDTFSAADVLVGSNIRVGQMLRILPAEGVLGDYVARLIARAAFIRATAIEAREGERFPVAG